MTDGAFARGRADAQAERGSPPEAEVEPVAKFLPLTVAEILRAAAGRPPPAVYATGFEGFDRLTEGGIRSRELTVIAAPPGAGKTGLVGMIAGTMARVRPVLWVTTELDEETQAARLAAPTVPCRPAEILDRGIDPAEIAARVADWPLHVAELPPLLVSDPIAWIEDAAQAIQEVTHQFPVIVIDYLQMLAVEGERERVRTSVGRVAYSLLRLARRLDVPVLAVSSVSRANYHSPKPSAEGNEDPRDWLAVAKESGDIEFAAAVLAYLETSSDVGADGASLARLVLAKVRRGQRGFVGLRFWGAQGRFTEEASAIAHLGPAKKDSQDEQRILRVIKLDGPLKRTDLRGYAGISNNRIHRAVERLLERGALEQRSEIQRDTKGRNRAVLMLCMPSHSPVEQDDPDDNG